MKSFKFVYFFFVVIFACLIFISVGESCIATETLRFNFSEPILEKTKNNYQIKIEGLDNFGNPGEPILPFKTIKILVPFNAKTQNIEVNGFEKTTLDGNYLLKHGQKPIPLSFKGTITPIEPNKTIYNSINTFPDNIYSQYNIQELRGYRILILNLYPVGYIPKTGKIYYYKNIEVNVYMKSAPNTPTTFAAMQKTNFRGIKKDELRVKNFVDNPQTINSYNKVKTQIQKLKKTPSGLRHLSIAESTEQYDYVIITNQTLNSSFQKLINWKKTRPNNPINATIVLVENITTDSDYWCNGVWGDGCGNGSQFNDTQAMIRNFIKNAYNNWSIEYVLLGGDVDIIPARGVYGNVNGGDYTDKNIPCDMYYGALNGSWDADNDSTFGEYPDDKVDFLAEVYIGRAPVDTITQADNFVNKIIGYENASFNSENYLGEALMVGEQLDDSTNGGDAKNTVANNLSHFNITKLYDKDGTFSKTAVKSQMNKGIHIINHDGHANNDTVMDFDSSDVNNLVNDKYFFIYSVGCYSASFNEDDAIAEYFVFSKNASFSYIGNTRYGWYLQGGAGEGPSDRFDQEFFDAVSDENITNIGKALSDSKEDLYNIMTEDTTGAYRWVYFNLVLLGDPETNLATSNNPKITILSPLNKTYNDTKSIWFNVSVNENASWCGYSLNNVSNITMQNDSTNRFFYSINSTMTEGGHYAIFYCNDTVGNMNYSVVYFRINITKPIVKINYPKNYAFLNNKTIKINITLTDNNLNYTNISIYNSSGIFINSTANETNKSQDYSFVLSVDEEGNYTINATSYDLSDNSGSDQINITIDTIYPTIKFNITQTNLFLSKNYIYTNWTFNETNLANFTAKLFNSNKNLTKKNITGHQYINWTNLNDGKYFYNITICDKAGNCNNTDETRNITLDTTPPNIIFYTISPKAVILKYNISINISAIDDNLNTIFANITFPDKNFTIINIFPANFTANQTGRYNITFFANDSAGNTANKTDYFICKNSTQFNTTINTTGNSTIVFYFQDTNEIIKNSTNSTNITIPNYVFDIEIKSFNNLILLRLNNINISQNNNKEILIKNETAQGYIKTIAINTSFNFTNANLTIYYNESDFTNENYSSVWKCPEWNFSANECINNNWINYTNHSKQNKTNNYFKINTDSFSAFSLKQEAYCGDGTCNSNDNENCQTCLADCKCSSGYHCENGVCKKDNPAPLSPSSGNGRGSGTPPTTETIIINFIANTPKTINFLPAKNLLDEIQITTTLNLQNIKITLKKLSTKPSDVLTPVLDNIYKYIQITHKNLSDENIKEAQIIFAVEKKWIIDNNEDKNNIVLLRYNNNEWEELKTIYYKFDANYYYFQAKSSGLSYFAVGIKENVLEKEKKEEKYEPNQQEIKTENFQRHEDNNKQIDKQQLDETQEKPKEKTFDYIILILFIAIVLAIFLKKFLLRYNLN